MHDFTWTDEETGLDISVHRNLPGPGRVRITAPVGLCLVTHPKVFVSVDLPEKFLAAYSRDAALREAIEALRDLT